MKKNYHPCQWRDFNKYHLKRPKLYIPLSQSGGSHGKINQRFIVKHCCQSLSAAASHFRDATIDYIIYRRGGRVTSYAPGNLEVTKEN